MQKPISIVQYIIAAIIILAIIIFGKQLTGWPAVALILGIIVITLDSNVVNDLIQAGIKIYTQRPAQISTSQLPFISPPHLPGEPPPAESPPGGTNTAAVRDPNNE